MKLADLGLKTKPATKYFDKGFISFSTTNGELFYKITCYDSARNQFVLIDRTKIKDKQQFEQLMKTKTIKDVVIE